MKKLFVLLATAALVVQAWSAPITSEQAKTAAQAWATRGQALGARFGASVERAAALAVATNATVYAVKMAGGGTVFVSGDDAYEPVVAFTAATNDFSKVDRRSPLWALLRRDAEVRAKMVAAGVTVATTAKKTPESPKTTHLSYEPDDVRVAPLVQSQWNQTTADGKLCYSRYTPLMPSGAHATCGCVATAMAQVMRYHQFPTAAREPVTRKCYVNVYAATKANDPDCVTNMTTMAGVYDWANMPLVPEDGVTDAQCEAIGKLTHDAGVSVRMSYNNDGAGSSGTFLFNAPTGLKEAFGYANADYYSANEVTESTSAMQRGFFANLDAGYPVLMGISGDGGHAIIGDGYGYSGGKPYVHLNMGWSGEDDFWYNLPDIDTYYYHFTVFDSMVCNIFPEATGAALLTGRVTDDDGNARDGVEVSVYEAGTTTLVANGATSETGVYGVRVPVGTYDVAFEKEGYPSETIESVRVTEAETVPRSFSGIITIMQAWTEGYSDVPVVSTFGNSYGNDVTFVEPCAQIKVGAKTKLYSTLDKAIAGGAALAAAGELSDVTIELLKDIPLKATATVGYACKITTADGAATTPTVTRSGLAALSVAAGGALELKNVNFAKGATTVVTVAAGGELRLGAGVDFAVPATIAAVQTADAAGFVLLEGITSGFTLDCEAAKASDDVFGSSWCSAADVSASAALIANVYDVYGELRGAVEELEGETVLKWKEIPVPVSESAGYFVDKDGKTNTAARLDRVFEKYAAQREAGNLGASCEIVVCNRADLTFTERIEVTGGLTVRGALGTSLVTLSSWGDGKNAGFDVMPGATLTIRDLSFSGYEGEAFLRVKGGDLKVGGVTTFDSFSGTNKYSGVIAVLSGSATLGVNAGDFVSVSNCQALAKNGKGGALYLKDGSCSATLRHHVEIRDCCARSGGGGVYLDGAADDFATIGLSGQIVIDGNFRKPDQAAAKANNVEIGSMGSAALASSIVLAGELGTGSSVGVSQYRAATGGTFARVASDYAPSSGYTKNQSVGLSSSFFFCDTVDALFAQPDASYASIQWAKDDGGIKEVKPEDAEAIVTTASGAVGYYGSIEDAFGAASDGATITVLKDVALETDVAVTAHVTVVSGTGGPFSVSRAAQCRVKVLEGGDLTLKNITFRGKDSASGEEGTGIFFDVEKGSMTLDDGATICDVESRGGEQTGGAVYVYDGTFTMKDGAAIRGCLITAKGNQRGAAVAADHGSTVTLLGGEIKDCMSENGGGVYIGNESELQVGGTFVAVNNTDTAGALNNVYIPDRSSLVLTSPFTGKLGWTQWESGASNVFGRVAANFSGTDTQKANSAHNFTHDQTGDVGIAVKPKTGRGETLLVWSNALDVNGEVVVNGTNYVMVAGGETLTAAVTDTTTGFVYDGTEKTPLFVGCGFVVTCTPQTDVGAYTATLTPKKGFAWDDGTTAAKTYSWEIAKATYDMSGVTFDDVTVEYDGKVHSVALKGKLPGGVTVSYSGSGTTADGTEVTFDGNGATDVGVYAVTASFTIPDPANYNSIPSLTATLTITEKSTPEPDPPTPSVVTNYPTPIAFQSITKASEEGGKTTWQLVVTNRVPWCNYRLIFTDDLAKGFTTTGAWEQAAADADPVWTTNVTTTTGKFFWRAEAKEGERK